MAHTDQIQFFQQVIQHFPGFFSGKVIDIGSNDINGGPHKYVNASEYVGVDLGPGTNVNLVSRGEEVQLPSGYFDVAMSSECFEHAPTWRAILLNMIRMTRPGGLVAFSCATTGRPEHEPLDPMVVLRRSWLFLAVRSTTECDSKSSA